MSPEHKQGSFVPEINHLNWDAHLENLRRVDQLRLAHLRLPPLLQRSAAIAELMQKLEQQRKDASEPLGRRGRRRIAFLADEDRFALAFIVASSEFRGTKPHRAAMTVAEWFSPGKSAHAGVRISYPMEGLIRFDRVLLVGNVPDPSKQVERARTLVKKLKSLETIERDWCWWSARNVALLTDISTQRTETLVAACRLAQLGWNAKLPDNLRIDQEMIWDAVGKHPKRKH